MTKPAGCPFNDTYTCEQCKAQRLQSRIGIKYAKHMGRPHGVEAVSLRGHLQYVNYYCPINEPAPATEPSCESINEGRGW